MGLCSAINGLAGKVIWKHYDSPLTAKEINEMLFPAATSPWKSEVCIRRFLEKTEANSRPGASGCGKICYRRQNLQLVRTFCQDIIKDERRTFPPEARKDDQE